MEGGRLDHPCNRGGSDPRIRRVTTRAVGSMSSLARCPHCPGRRGPAYSRADGLEHRPEQLGALAVRPPSVGRARSPAGVLGSFDRRRLPPPRTTCETSPGRRSTASGPALGTGDPGPGAGSLRVDGDALPCPSRRSRCSRSSSRRPTTCRPGGLAGGRPDARRPRRQGDLGGCRHGDLPRGRAPGGPATAGGHAPPP